ncbi:AI-2E family transporter [Candidatus Parcubacteria bacterium]|nr:AI-2E family transporter [Candidatus Parcubacteria bacterium]
MMEALKNHKNRKLTIDFSVLSIIKILSVLLLCFFLYKIANILIILFVAFVIATIINPIANWLHRYYIPRALGTLLIYVILLVIISSIFVLLAPPIIEQINELAKNFPSYSQKIYSVFYQFKEYLAQLGFEDSIQKALNFLQSNIGSGAKNVFSLAIGLFGGIASFFIVLVIAFYMILQEKSWYNFLDNIVTKKRKERIIKITHDIQDKLGVWARAQLILCVAIFILTFIGLSLFNIKYALVLALIAGLFEFIPYLGPIIGAIPAVLLTLLYSPSKAIVVIAIYVVIQQIENNLLVPNIMKKAVGVNPIISIISLIIGFQLAGIVGGILAMPVVLTISVVINNLIKEE